MLSRLHLSPQKLWWVLMLVPPFLIIDSWLLDILMAYGVSHLPAFGTSFLTIRAYIFWNRFDFCSKWLVGAAVAALLVFNQDNLKSLSPLKQWAPWIVVLVVIGLEFQLRGSLWDINWAGTPLSPIQWYYVATPPRLFTFGGRMAWTNGFNSPWAAFFWATRPMRAFAMMTLLFWSGRLISKKVVARRDQGRLAHHKLA